MRWEVFIWAGWGGRGDMTYRWLDLLMLVTGLVLTGLIVWWLEATSDA